MSITAIIALLQVVVAEAPQAISTVEQLYSLGQKFFATVNGREPSADETAQLQSAIDTDVAEALKPLPEN